MKKKATARPAKATSCQSTLNFPTSSEADLVAEAIAAETSTKSGAKNRRKRTADFADDADKHNKSHCDSSAISAQSAVKTQTSPTTETVPKNWRLTTISEIAESLDNRRIPVNKAERAKRHGTIPYYGANGQVGWIDNHIFDEPLVLVVEDETFTGRTLPFSYVIRGMTWVNNHAHVLRAKELVTTEFLNYSLSFYPFTPLTTGSTGRRKLTKNALMSAPYLLPPLPEQIRIVAEIEKQFTRLDAGVAALKRVQANLKRYRAAVLKAACEGKLVPTEAELRRTAVKTPPFETGAQLLQRILNERIENWQGRGKFKVPFAPDSVRAGNLPEGWTWATLDQICDKITDGEHLSPETTSSGVRLLSAKDVREAGVQLNDPKFVSSEDAEQFRKRCNPAKGDVLIVSRGATIGRICVVQIDDIFCLMGSVILLKPNRAISGKFLSICLTDRRARVILGLLSGSTAQQAIYIRDIRPFAIPLPPLAEQTRIVAEVERRLSVVDELDAVVSVNLQRANRLRQSILQRAFTGELKT